MSCGIDGFLVSIFLMILGFVAGAVCVRSDVDSSNYTSLNNDFRMNVLESEVRHLRYIVLTLQKDKSSKEK